MDWDFTENIAFKALYEAFKDSDETSALEFLSSDGASYYLELTQDAAGEGLDLGDNETMEEFLARRENEGTDKGALCPHCGLRGTMREMVEHHDVCPAFEEEDG